MTRRHDAPQDLAVRPFRLSAAGDRASDADLRGPAYVTPLRGTRQEASMPVTHGRRIQAALALHPGAVLVGPSAAWAMGSRAATDQDPVHLVAPVHLRRTTYLHPHQWRLPDQELIQLDMGRATRVERTCWDLARGMALPLRPATALDPLVIAVDQLLHATGARVVDVLAWSHDRGGRHAVRARTVLGMCSDGMESPRETLVRLAVLRAGLPPPVPQYVVRDMQGRTVARLDLAWTQRRVGLEYDGAQHRDKGQHSRDLRRHNQLRDLGWRVMQVDDAAYRRLEGVLATLRGWLV